jgi:hypothetical protein
MLIGYIPYAMSIFGVGIGISWYQRVNVNQFKMATVSCIMKIVRMYTALEHHTQSLFNEFFPIQTCPSSVVHPTRIVKNNISVALDHIQYLHNGENVELDADFVTYSISDGGTMILPPINSSLLCKGESSVGPDGLYRTANPSTIYFISFSVTYQDYQEQDGSPVSISFKTASTNYFMVGNKIDKYMVWYLTKQQHQLNRFNVPYTATIIDNNVGVQTITDKNTICILQDSYTIS